MAEPRLVEFPSEDSYAYGYFYAPTNLSPDLGSDFKPPLLVKVRESTGRLQMSRCCSLLTDKSLRCLHTGTWWTNVTNLGGLSIGNSVLDQSRLCCFGRGLWW
jgi:hypothetical protein